MFLLLWFDNNVNQQKIIEKIEDFTHLHILKQLFKKKKQSLIM